MSYLSEQIADGALAAWMLADAQGSSTMLDSSGNARNGTHINCDCGATPALIGTATCTRYNGVDSLSQVTSASWMNVTNITTEAVVRPSVNNAIQQLFSRESSTSANRSFQFRINAAGKIEFIFFDAINTIRTVTGATVLSRYGSPVHVAATYDGTTAKVLLSGVVDGTLSISGTMRIGGSAPIEVGRINTSGGASTWLSGALAGVGIYGTALSTARLAVHAAAINSGTSPWDGSGTWGLVG